MPEVNEDVAALQPGHQAVAAGLLDVGPEGAVVRLLPRASGGGEVVRVVAGGAVLLAGIRNGLGSVTC